MLGRSLICFYPRWAAECGLLPDHRFVIQIPRRAHGLDKGNSFQSWLETIFRPLFEVTLNPGVDKDLAKFLECVVAFDSVPARTSDGAPFGAPTENVTAGVDSPTSEYVLKRLPPPDQFVHPPDPPYTYHLYYLYANLYVLNQLREQRNLNPFFLRPHCGDPDSRTHDLCTGFLLAHGTSHSIKLADSPGLSYLFYLAQIGVLVAPLSHNTTGVCSLKNSPVEKFFKQGLNVALATDRPLQVHATDQPLLEEYTIVQQFWKLSLTDVCELARASMLQVGVLDDASKLKFLGPNCVYKTYTHSRKCCWNYPEYSNVGNIRISFRHRTYAYELRILGLMDSSGTAKDYSADDLRNAETRDFRDYTTSFEETPEGAKKCRKTFAALAVDLGGAGDPSSGGGEKSPAGGRKKAAAPCKAKCVVM